MFSAFEAILFRNDNYVEICVYADRDLGGVLESRVNENYTCIPRVIDQYFECKIYLELSTCRLPAGAT